MQHPTGTLPCPLCYRSFYGLASLFLYIFILPGALTCPGWLGLVAAVSVPQIQILGQGNPERLGAGLQPCSHQVQLGVGVMATPEGRPERV